MRSIDCWLNVNMGELGRPDYLVEVAKNYFKQGEDFFRNYGIDETLALMDELEEKYNYYIGRIEELRAYKKPDILARKKVQK